MRRDRSDALFTRIGSYGVLLRAFFRKLLMYLAPPDRYRREAHYMRGPGPKSREQQSAQKPPKQEP